MKINIIVFFAFAIVSVFCQLPAPKEEFLRPPPPKGIDASSNKDVAQTESLLPPVESESLDLPLSPPNDDSLLSGGTPEDFTDIPPLAGTFAERDEQCKPFYNPPPPMPGPGPSPSPGPGPSPFPQPEVPFTFNETYTVIELDPETTGSRCLDGSNYKFYYAQGHGSGADKFVINWEGGAFCGVDGSGFLESCLGRSNIMLGSSKSWGQNMTSRQEMRAPFGYFSNAQEYNPDFWNWNKIMIKYCDGSLHQGFREEPVVVKGKELWFRGFNNTFATLNYAKEHFGLFEARQVIFSGQSTGGHAVYIWGSFLQNFFPRNVKLMGIPEAGLFMDVYNPQTECHLMRQLVKNVTNYTNSHNLDLFKNCPYKHSGVWKCLMPQYIILDLRFPLFVVNSQNDVEALKSQAGLNYSNTSNLSEKDKLLISKYRRNVMNLIGKLTKLKHWTGLWLPSCLEHVVSDGWSWYGQQKNVVSWRIKRTINLKDALHYWYNEGKILNERLAYFIDSREYDQNPTCK